MAEQTGIDALAAAFRAELGPPVEERIALAVDPQEMSARQLFQSVRILRTERDRLLASLVALVRKVNEDQVPAYYEDLVPADVLAEAFPSSPSGEQP